MFLSCKCPWTLLDRLPGSGFVTRNTWLEEEVQSGECQLELSLGLSKRIVIIHSRLNVPRGGAPLESGSGTNTPHLQVLLRLWSNVRHSTRATAERRRGRSISGVTLKWAYWSTTERNLVRTKVLSWNKKFSVFTSVFIRPERYDTIRASNTVRLSEIENPSHSNVFRGLHLTKIRIRC